MNIPALLSQLERRPGYTYVGTSASGGRMPVTLDPPPGAVVTEHRHVEYQNGIRVEYTTLSWSCE